MGGAKGWWAALALLAACGNDSTPALHVVLRTSLRPLQDFARVRTEIRRPVTRDGLHDVDPTRNYQAGVEIATETGLADGSYELLVSVLDYTGRVILVRAVTAEVQGDSTVWVIASCDDCGDVDAGASQSGDAGALDGGMPPTPPPPACGDVCIVESTCVLGVLRCGATRECEPVGVAPTGSVCRAEGGACDVAEACDGVSSACPSDTFRPAGELCRAMAGPCDVEELCDGVAATCPDDTFAPSSMTCREPVGSCDAVEHCTGSDAACPPDVIDSDGTMCRPPECMGDPAEACLAGDCADACGCIGQPCCGATCGSGLVCTDGTCCSATSPSLTGSAGPFQRSGPRGEITRQDLADASATGAQLELCATTLGCGTIMLTGFTMTGTAGPFQRSGPRGEITRQDLESAVGVGSMLRLCSQSLGCADLVIDGATATGSVGPFERSRPRGETTRQALATASASGNQLELCSQSFGCGTITFEPVLVCQE